MRPETLFPAVLGFVRTSDVLKQEFITSRIVLLVNDLIIHNGSSLSSRMPK